MGVKNRFTENGLETEILPLPDALHDRIRIAAENPEKDRIGGGWIGKWEEGKRSFL